MKTIYFATTNKQKIQAAQTVCSKADILVESVALDIDEIQGENSDAIVRNKAQQAYALLGKPVVVTDYIWDIHALGGFPGAYMKSINQWFKPKDFLRLMHGVKDRGVTLHQYLVYSDGTNTKVFINDIAGTIIHESRGENTKSPNTTVTVLDSDNGKTIAEVYELGANIREARYKDRNDIWQSFAEWYTTE